MQQYERKRYIYIGFIILFLSVGGLFYYIKITTDSLNYTLNNRFNQLQSTLNYNLTTIQDKLNNQVDSLNKSIIIFKVDYISNLIDLEYNLRNEIRNESSILKSNITTKISLVEEALDISKKEHQERINALSSEYNSRIKQLKDELSNFNVSTINIQSLDFSDTIKQTLPSVVSIITNKGQASGVFISNKDVITNYHAVSNASNITILTYKGKTYQVTLKSFNATIDLALLNVNSNEEFQPLGFVRLSDINLGSKVVALGNPYGLGFSVTEGIISGLNRIGPNGLGIYIQTDVPVNPGNSGGPLVDRNGDIVGITTFKITNSEGLGFAIGSDYVKAFIQS